MPRVAYFFTTTRYRGYSYPTSNGYSGGIQFEAGYPIEIRPTAEGEPLYRDGRYETLDGRWYSINDLTQPFLLVYEGGYGPCLPPTSVTLTGKVLRASGGGSGYQNPFAGYQYSYREHAFQTGTIPNNDSGWSAWSTPAVLGTAYTSTKTLEATPGKLWQLRARTVGVMDDDYASEWVVCATTLSGNTAPVTPVVVYPAEGAMSATLRPTIVVQCAADPDGDVLELWRRLSDGEWQKVNTAGNVGGTRVYDTLPTLAPGVWTVRYKAIDVHGLESGVAMVRVNARATTWARAISQGTVIANTAISHRADINELVAAVNKSRAFYGLSALAMLGTVGNFSDWKSQMETIQAGLQTACGRAGKGTLVWMHVPSYPTAAVINEIRNRIV